MEGLIPFVIDVIRRSHERGTYRSVSSDGSSHGSRRRLIDYTELPEAADDGAAASLRRAEEYGRPAAVAIGSAYRRK
ncbi:hypothetical protein PR202_ga29351 [Eleusine coracana subsp. coracana]|uniref:Uncharacterized protein n=1 Tax=Eleusine coracana subsp. coracana TaxID=191504 RepID=A0AAV5DKZ3_ELECO|nr:hypothetical protein QOZ80_7AG0575000 [Eleusine coracana subsp. coracana]GJN11178.1 hypothetical protein PR202_ga29351 [Eleusine coracana subsp. coracana]